ncbi:hydroxyacid dehydrogenase [Dinoroseobacter sp. S76]|uniref:hydroxyacid dehydrogenase n=1 Tax=Dinoroseobacter sp. S76 TaxID=3415124 RepID=UPI003C7EA4EC
MKVVITEFMDQDALTGFSADLDVRYAPDLVEDRAVTLAAAGEADALIVRNRTQVDAELLASAPKLRVVGRLGVGLDNIDMAGCAARGIAVCPAIGANTRSVAEYVIGTAFSLSRGAYAANAAMIAGEWPRGTLGQGGEIAGRTLGLLGFGAIAQAVAGLAAPLGLRVVAADPHLPPDHPAWRDAQRLSRETLLREADILSLHLPLTPETAGLLDAEALAQLKPGAIVINTSRGGIVDEAALCDALRTGRLGGAALDVFASEPLDATAGAQFADVPNLILTPHIAGVTAEANIRVSRITVDNVQRALMEPVT